MLHTTVRHRAARPHAAPAPLRSAGGPLSFRTLRASHGLARTPTAATCRRAAAAGAAARPSRSPSVRAFAILDAVKSFLGMGAKQSKGWAPSPSADVERRIAAGSCMDVTPLTEAQREEAAAALPQASKFIVLQHGTERPFSGSTVNGYPHNHKGKGTYVCALGGLPVFSSDTKFESGTGWPSFYAPFDPEHIIEVPDFSIPMMPRVEVLDRRSGAHLGHVFDDGPRPTGKRYCINAAALRFVPQGEPLE